MEFPKNVCEICHKAKGGPRHAECSRILQQRYAAMQQQKRRKLLTPTNVNYLTKTGA